MEFLYSYMTESELKEAKYQMLQENKMQQFDMINKINILKYNQMINDIETKAILEGYNDEMLTEAYREANRIYMEAEGDLWQSIKDYFLRLIKAIFGQGYTKDQIEIISNYEQPVKVGKLKKVIGMMNDLVGPTLVVLTGFVTMAVMKDTQNREKWYSKQEEILKAEQLLDEDSDETMTGEELAEAEEIVNKKISEVENGINKIKDISDSSAPTEKKDGEQNGNKNENNVGFIKKVLNSILSFLKKVKNKITNGIRKILGKEPIVEENKDKKEVKPDEQKPENTEQKKEYKPSKADTDYVRGFGNGEEGYTPDSDKWLIEKKKHLERGIAEKKLNKEYGKKLIAEIDAKLSERDAGNKTKKDHQTKEVKPTEQKSDEKKPKKNEKPDDFTIKAFNDFKSVVNSKLSNLTTILHAKLIEKNKISRNKKNSAEYVALSTDINIIKSDITKLNNYKSVKVTDDIIKEYRDKALDSDISKFGNGKSYKKFYQSFFNNKLSLEYKNDGVKAVSESLKNNNDLDIDYLIEATLFLERNEESSNITSEDERNLEDLMEMVNSI